MSLTAALPALVSPIIEACIESLKERHEHALKAQLIMALEQSKLWEEVAKENARLALDRWSQLQTKEQIINKLMQDVKHLQAEASNE